MSFMGDSKVPFYLQLFVECPEQSPLMHKPFTRNSTLSTHARRSQTGNKSN